ncbi:MAG: class I tRNA ligase family protein, partial [Erysipelotrichaceae bacterium]|nr:class I tRNA ligase family protein [Erysipelotrichaceae bacterium]
DIMDVWFDSGSSWNELIARGYSYPCDIYFEGSDQYRGWFNSSLIVSVANHGCAPYKAVLSHGYVCDSKGEAMHKSVGNVVNPIDIIDRYGADILRLWAGTSDFRSDMRIGDSNLKQVSEQYRKVRNTFRFLLGNLDPSDFDPAKDLLPFEDLEPIDQYVSVTLNELVRNVRDAYDRYDYVAVSSLLTNYMSIDLSSYYCDFAKDILYIEKADGKRRRQVQSVLYRALDAITKLWSPILVFTSEEVFRTYSKEAASVHYTHFPDVLDLPGAEELLTRFNRLNAMRDDILKALEEARMEKLIGKSLEAEVVLHVSEEDRKLLEWAFGEKVMQWLIVSKVSYTEESLNRYNEIEVAVKKAPGKVCPRCWNITETDDEEGLCDRCREVLGRTHE